jgi:N-acetylneuraminic acid mutarotase
MHSRRSRPVRVSHRRAAVESLEGRCLFSSAVVVPPPAPFSWTTAANAPVARLEASAVAVGKKLYLFGGYGVDSPNWLATKETDAFDPATNTWTRLADMPEGVTHIGAAADGHYIYAAGGYVSNYVTKQQTFATRHVWRYDTVSNTWSAFVPLPAARGAGALVILNHQLHYVDGIDSNRNGTTDHWVLNLRAINLKWVSSTPLPFSRNHIAATVLNGKIYIVGGQALSDDASPPCSDVLMWDPLHPSAWQRMANLPQPRSHAIVFAVDGQLVLMDGSTTGQKVLNSVMAYNPTTNNWRWLPDPVPGPRLGPAGDIVDGKLVITTGYLERLRSGTWESLLPLTL